MGDQKLDSPPFTPPIEDRTLSYTCFPTGKVQTITSSNANSSSVSYTYDDLNRLSIVVDNRLPGNSTSAYTYDAASMSFFRHGEIYPPDVSRKTGSGVGAPLPALIGTDESPPGYSLAGCSPAEPATASPAIDHSQGEATP